jgi:hypothetical protein
MHMKRELSLIVSCLSPLLFTLGGEQRLLSKGSAFQLVCVVMNSLLELT